MTQAFKVTAVRDVTHPALVQYLDSRCIPQALARQHLKEIHFQPVGGAGRYFALGFPCGDGWDARSAVFKGFIGTTKDITFLDAGDGSSVAVFEGVMDYLSLLAHLNVDALPGYSVLILHSTAQVDRALKRLAGRHVPNVLLYLDHDAAGRAATRVLQDAFGPAAIDRSDLYAGHPDLNAWRIATRRKTMTDIDKLDVKQLDALIVKAQTAKAQLRERRRQELRAEFERRSASEGFTLTEVVSAKRQPTRAAKYAHPTDPALTWTGLGRVPKWLTKLAGGEGIERFRVGR